MKSLKGISLESNDRTLITLASILAIAGLVVVVYSESFAAMAELWQHSDYRYGVLVFPIVGYLLWRSRAELAAVHPRPCALGVAPLAILVFCWAVSRAIGVQVVEQLSAMLLIPAAVVTFLGAQVARRVLFPLAFLVVAVPVGEIFVPYLMRTTAAVSVVLLRTVGVPVFREGQFLTLPGGRFVVAEVCAGLHYVTSGTIIALLFAYFTYQSNVKRALFVAVSAATMVLGNGVRAFIVMLVASATDMRLLAGRDHVFFGWLLFGSIVFALLWVGLRFADVHELHGAEGAIAKDQVSRKGLPLLVAVLVFVMLAATARDFQRVFSDWIVLSVAAVLLAWVLLKGMQVSDRPSTAGMQMQRFGNWRAAVVICCACGVLGVGPLLLSRSVRAAVQPHESRVLPSVAGCGSPAPWSVRWRPEFQAPSTVISGTYDCAEPVSVFIAVYGGNVQGSELVSDRNKVIPSEWRAYSSEMRESFADAAGRPVAVNEVRVQGGNGDSLVWFWYRIGERTATSPAGVKLLQALEFVTAGKSESEVYFLETPLAPALELGRQRLQAMASQLAAGGNAVHRAQFDAGHE